MTITAIGETVTAAARGAIEAAFGIPLITQFTSTLTLPTPVPARCAPPSRDAPTTCSARSPTLHATRKRAKPDDSSHSDNTSEAHPATGTYVGS